jgi:hypothetical protein
MSTIIATHESQEKVHNLQTVIAMRCETTHNYPSYHWQNNHGKQFADSDPMLYKKALLEFQSSEGTYIDAHKWRFTPERFHKTICVLNELGYTNYEIDEIFDTKYGLFEFYVVLRKK